MPSQDGAEREQEGAKDRGRERRGRSSRHTYGEDETPGVIWRMGIAKAHVYLTYLTSPYLPSLGFPGQSEPFRQALCPGA